MGAYDIPTSPIAPLGGIPLLVRTGAGWQVVRLLLEEDVRLAARLKRGEDWLEITVFRPVGDEPAFARLAHCAVRYRGHLAGAAPDTLAEARAIILGLAEAVDARLAAAPDRPFAEALGRDPTPRRIRFDQNGLLDLLAPDVRPGADLGGGYRLSGVYPGSHLADRARRQGELVLDFRRGESERLRILVAPADPAIPTFLRTTHFDVSYLTGGDGAPQNALAVVAAIAFLLQVRDGPHLEVVVPETSAALLEAPDEAASRAAADEVLNLAIDTECHQACAFCSVKAVSAPVTGDDALHGRLLADLASNRSRGVTAVRINGYDPLSYGRILEILDAVRAHGYRQVALFSTFTRVADPAFCEALLERLPDDTTFNVPVYAADPSVHDAVVGRPGAHGEVMRALENIRARRGPERIRVNAVAVRENLDALPALARWARAQGFGLRIQTPYPSSESPDDAFHRAAARQTEIAEAMAEQHGDEAAAFVVAGVAPCIVHRAMAERGIPASAWVPRLWMPPVLPGAEYADARYRHRAAEAEHDAFHVATVPCPHAAECALAGHCPKAVLRAYVVRYGDEEIAPVSLREILDLEHAG